MKVIDLLNKIVNGEEVPKKIEFDNIIYDRRFDGDIYYYDNWERETLFLATLDTTDELNEEIKIIEDEETEEKEIEKLDFRTLNTDKEKRRAIKIKINEIIDEVNKLKENK